MSGSDFESFGRKYHTSAKRRFSVERKQRGKQTPSRRDAKKSKERIFEQKFRRTDSHPILRMLE